MSQTFGPRVIDRKEKGRRRGDGKRRTELLGLSAREDESSVRPGIFHPGTA